ncbi:MAG: hypothetical protein WA955_15825 [Diaphorobacter nitroreducens]|uniref:hypothetical protein n=1 Tax=Diaphorobacter nitroreducens TaxID=164759 RepID=UPI003C783A3E
MSPRIQDPVTRACRLLREAADELQQSHTTSRAREDWTGEPEAKAAYDENRAVADALEQWAEAIGAGGVEPLRRRECLHQIAEPAGEYPPLPEPDLSMPWRVNAKSDGAAHSSGFTYTQMRAYVDADRAMRAQAAQEPYCWHYWSSGGASVYHRGPSKMLDADKEAAAMYPKAHHCIPLYTHPAPQPAPVAQGDALSEIVGCLDAANVEGLDDALVNNTDARLADLVQRRLLPAFYVAIAAQAKEGGGNG